MLRELAFIDLENEPAPAPEDSQALSEEDFDAQVALAAQGRWEDLDLDPLPEEWQPSSIEDLRNA